jgi:hypothetical protein
MQDAHKLDQAGGNAPVTDGVKVESQPSFSEGGGRKTVRENWACGGSIG